MKWNVDQELIFDDVRCVGSLIKTNKGKWMVEILWSANMDLKFETDNFASAIGFIAGVEKTFIALGVKEDTYPRSEADVKADVEAFEKETGVKI